MANEQPDRPSNGRGRHTDFGIGIQGARAIAGAYRNVSVLDNYRPSTNGLGQEDYKRRVYYGTTQSALGSDSNTFETRNVWLRNGVRNPALEG